MCGEDCMTGSTCGAGTAYHSGAQEFTHGGFRVARCLIFCVVSCIWIVDHICTFSFGHCIVFLLRSTDSDYPFGIFDLRILITSLWYLRSTDSDYPFGIFKLFSLFSVLCFIDRCLSFCFLSFWPLHCLPSSIYGFWLPHWSLQTFPDL